MKNISVAIAAITLGAVADVREVTFQREEMPTDNPRIERRGNTITHVEVFGAFEIQEDGSAKTRVIESAGDMPQGALSDFVTSAQQQMAIFPTWESIAATYSNRWSVAMSEYMSASNRAARAEARTDALASWAEEQRDKAALPTTKAIWQAIINKIRGDGN